jgi:hypothetical protein
MACRHQHDGRLTWKNGDSAFGLTVVLCLSQQPVAATIITTQAATTTMTPSEV